MLLLLTIHLSIWECVFDECFGSAFRRNESPSLVCVRRRGKGYCHLGSSGTNAYFEVVGLACLVSEESEKSDTKLHQKE